MPSDPWRRHFRLAILLLIAGSLIAFRREVRGTALFRWFRGAHSVESRIAQLQDAVAARLQSDFKRVGVPYPPAAVAFVGLKEERVLQVYAAGSGGRFFLVRTYPILAASGRLGPKLREGDLQVPEGIYRLESLNPNSAFHISLRLDYPNSFDRTKAKAEGRFNLGGDIMIHGRQASIGCLAMGDPAAEDLFVLAALAGLENVRVVLSPVDLRSRPMPVTPGETPKWLPELYDQIRTALSEFPAERRNPENPKPAQK